MKPISPATESRPELLPLARQAAIAAGDLSQACGFKWRMCARQTNILSQKTYGMTCTRSTCRSTQYYGIPSRDLRLGRNRGLYS